MAAFLACGLGRLKSPVALPADRRVKTMPAEAGRDPGQKHFAMRPSGVNEGGLGS
jgi:hypothetical protein